MTLLFSHIKFNNNNNNYKTTSTFPFFDDNDDDLENQNFYSHTNGKVCNNNKKVLLASLQLIFLLCRATIFSLLPLMMMRIFLSALFECEWSVEIVA
jgi:hypothetical protein